MAPMELGLVIVTGELKATGTTRWTLVRDLALRAEAMGLDTVWVIDELLWSPKDKPRQGFWDGVAMAGAVAAVTSRIKVGTWILSALHRNAGITAKAVETIDEISGGRFVFGLGAGHVWPGQATAFGLPEDHIHSRFEEALQVIVPLLRDGRADFQGAYHSARDLEQRPVGPRPGRIPLMIGGHGPKMLRLAATHADIWSCYAEEHNDLTEFGPRIAAFEAACVEVGRDPATIGRSAGISVAPLVGGGAPLVGGGEADEATSADDAPSSDLHGDAESIAAAFRTFEDAGYTQLEFLLAPQTVEALDAMAPVVARYRDR